MINLPAGQRASYQAVALQEAFGLALLAYALGHRPLFNVYTIIKPDLLSNPPITTPSLVFLLLFTEVHFFSPVTLSIFTELHNSETQLYRLLMVT